MIVPGRIRGRVSRLDCGAVIALIQRVVRAGVMVDGQSIAEIERGILALIGVSRGDEPLQATRLIERVLTYRVFPDDAGRMNRSVVDVGGGLLLVPQFTLAADTQKGTRAGFSAAAEPATAERLFDTLVALARERHPNVAAGTFGAYMHVSLVNDGPVTFWLEA